MKILVTGVAGFIGMHVAHRLLADGHEVVGIDNLNDYYAVSLKESRLKELGGANNFKFIKLDLADTPGVQAIFAREEIISVVHLAAQPGVRYSLINPHAYISSNLVAFTNILEGCRHHKIAHLVYASSSSVYGANTRMPFSVHDNVDHPVSLYAATKKSNELMAHTYSHLYSLPTTGLRFFTVYGPWGRPDMSPTLFARAISQGLPLDVFNFGDMQRDFTYIDDIVEGVARILAIPAAPDEAFDKNIPDPASSFAPYRIYNIGNNEPVALMDFIGLIENALGKKAKLNLLPMQPGDVHATYANIDDLKAAVGFAPKTPLKVGITKFVDWYQRYYKNEDIAS